MFDDRDSVIRQFAVTAMAQTGATAIPVLIEALHEPRLRSGAVEALVQIGPPSAELLLPHLQEELPDLRYTVTDILERIGPIVLPQLLERIRSHSPEHAGAAAALDSFGYDALPSLIEMLNDPDVQHRVTAAAALVKLGPKAVNALLLALEHPNVGVAWLAAKALGQIGPSALPDMMANIGRTNRSVRWILFDVLRKMGPEAAHYLEKELRSSDPLVRETAAHTLGEIPEYSLAALPAMKEALLHETDPNVREILNHAVSKLELHA